MVNLYELLGISHTANEDEIKAAIAKHFANSSLQDAVLSKAKEWLLNAEIRAKYDAKLLSAYPSLNTLKPTEPVAFANLYEFLGIATDANSKEIEEAINALHAQNADARQLNLCRNYLLNAERRKKYDIQQGIAKAEPVKSTLPKKKIASQVQPAQQVVVKNTGCFGVAGGILLAIAIIIIAPILLLGMCTASVVSSANDYTEKSKKSAERSESASNASSNQQKPMPHPSLPMQKSIAKDYSALTRGGNGSQSSPYVFVARELSRIYSAEGDNLQPMLSGTYAHITGKMYEAYTDRGTPEVLLAGADGKPIVYARVISSERNDLKTFQTGEQMLLEDCAFTSIENGYIKYQGCTVKAWSEYGK